MSEWFCSICADPIPGCRCVDVRPALPGPGLPDHDSDGFPPRIVLGEGCISARSVADCVILGVESTKVEVIFQGSDGPTYRLVLERVE